MSYSKKVVEYFMNQDLSELEDLANQISEGAYSDELSGWSEAQLDDLIENVKNGYDLTPLQLEAIKKMNHIGAYVILANALEV